MADKPKKTKTRKPNVGSDPTKGRRVWFWQIGLYAFSLGSSFILLAITLNRLIEGRFTSGPAIASLVISGLSWGLIKGASEQKILDPGGSNITTAEPALTAFVQQVADHVNAPMPDAIYLVAEARLTVTEETSYFGLRHGQQVLVVGLPYLQAMTRSELAAGIAHHLGHYADSDIDRGRQAMRALRNAGDLVIAERDGAVNAVYGSYARKIFRSVGGVGVAHEHAAEQVAIDAYGTEAMKSALVKLDDVAIAWDQLLRDYVVPSLQNEAHPLNLLDGFAELLKSGARAQARADDVDRRRNQEGNEWDPHNSPGERLQILEGQPHVEGAAELDDPTGSALGLLDSEAKSSEIVVAQWAHKLMGKRTTGETWQQLNDQVFSAATHTLAAKGFDGADDLEGDDQLDLILEWTDADWASLDEKLRRVKALDGEAMDRRATWTQAVLVEAAASSGNFRWHENWDGPPKLVDTTGTAFDPEPVAALLVAGETGQAHTAFKALVDAAS